MEVSGSTSPRVQLRRASGPRLLAAVCGLLIGATLSVGPASPFSRVVVIDATPTTWSPLPDPAKSDVVGLDAVRQVATDVPLPSGTDLEGYRLSEARLVYLPFGPLIRLHYDGDPGAVVVLVQPYETGPAVAVEGLRTESLRIAGFPALIIYGSVDTAPQPAGFGAEAKHRLTVVVEMETAAVTVMADDRTHTRDKLVAFAGAWVVSAAPPVQTGSR